MWSNNDKNIPGRGFLTPQPPPPPASWRTSMPHSPAAVVMPMSERKRVSPACKRDLFHVIHKVPPGDSPYVRAKHVQLIEKDPSKAISLFWAAINTGDRVDSALKDMAVVMKQLNRSDEAIEAIKSFRHLCPYDSQESIDNVLVELYKRSGRIEEEIEMLHRKLKNMESIAFGGKRTKIARSQGKKIQITIEQERSRVLGNLAWAYLQQHNYGLAEQYYRKALSLEPDKNKQCNLAICLMHMNRIPEAKSLLQVIESSCGSKQMDDSYAKSFERAVQMLTEVESQSTLNPTEQDEDNQRSSVLPTNRKLKEVSSSTNGDQSCVPGFTHSTRWEDGHNEEVVLSDEKNRGSYCRNHSENEGHFIEYNKGSSKCVSSGLRGFQSSPQAAVDIIWREGFYFESPGERSGFESKMRENWVSSTGTELRSVHKKTFPSPSPTLHTQPRRCSWGFKKGDQKGPRWGEKTVEQPFQNMPRDTIRNLNGELLDLTESETTLKNSQSSSSSATERDRRREWRDVAVLEPLSQPTMRGHRTGTSWGYDGYANVKDEEMIEYDSRHASWKRNFQENDAQRKPAMEISNISPKFLMEQTVVVGNSSVSEASADGEWDKSSGVTLSGNMTSTDTVGDESIRRSNSAKSFHKSWADMVEEDEHELLTGKDLGQCFEGWNGEQESNNENLNSNIIHQDSCLESPVETISQKLETFDLKDGSGTSSSAVSSRNSTVRRSLCFETEKDTNMKRKNRLKVFRDITPSPDSP